MQFKHKHHVIPKHAGGTDDPSNIVELTIEEHAEAHKKLFEEYGRWQDYLAWKGLSKQIPYRDIDEEVKKERARKIAEYHKGRPKSAETKASMSKSAKIRSNTPEGLAHLRSICNNGLGKTKSDDTKKAIREALQGKPKSKEHKKALCKPKSIKLGWFTDGVINLKLRLDSDIPENFYRGRTL